MGDTYISRQLAITRDNQERYNTSQCRKKIAKSEFFEMPYRLMHTARKRLCSINCHRQTERSDVCGKCSLFSSPVVMPLQYMTKSCLRDAESLSAYRIPLVRFFIVLFYKKTIPNRPSARISRIRMDVEAAKHTSNGAADKP